VLLVDDDASIRRLVELALEEMPIELLLCASVAEARAALAAGPVALLITDLMMPGESGLDLLAALVADPALRAGARLAVFSAGLHGPLRARLADLGVWRLLDKPVALQVLEQCVADATGLNPGLPPDAAGPAAGDAATSGGPAPALDHDEQAALADAFGGDLALFLAFRAQARSQFAEDAATLVRAMERGDGPALQRGAHSLKGVLATLGDPVGTALARRLEQAAAAADFVASASLAAELAAHVDARSHRAKQ
jgi:CheY-like chemotaxis protein